LVVCSVSFDGCEPVPLRLRVLAGAPHALALSAPTAVKYGCPFNLVAHVRDAYANDIASAEAGGGGARARGRLPFELEALDGACLEPAGSASHVANALGAVWTGNRLVLSDATIGLPAQVRLRVKWQERSSAEQERTRAGQERSSAAGVRTPAQLISEVMVTLQSSGKVVRSLEVELCDREVEPGAVVRVRVHMRLDNGGLLHKLKDTRELQLDTRDLHSGVHTNRLFQAFPDPIRSSPGTYALQAHAPTTAGEYEWLIKHKSDSHEVSESAPPAVRARARPTARARKRTRKRHGRQRCVIASAAALHAPLPTSRVLGL
jgi:hypothetical protein